MELDFIKISRLCERPLCVGFLNVSDLVRG
jgi:hypothetical protein